VTEPFYGYRFEIEDRAALTKSCLATNDVMSGLQDVVLPEEVDPRHWLRIENQKNMGSCQGHEQTTVGEMAYYIASGGEVIQFSPLFAYYSTQEIDGLAGSDSGSTISGGAKNAKERGLCPLELMPYPDPVRYNWNIPKAAKEAALDFRINYIVTMTTYNDIKRFIGSGQGGVGIGILWSSNVMTPNSSGCIENYSAGGGGHAVSLVGYTKRKHRDGRNYILLANSWDTTWGNKGFTEVSPVAIDQMLASRYTVMIGMSDLKSPKIRKYPDYSPW
jgi:C1A family cysteine protease